MRIILALLTFVALSIQSAPKPNVVVIFVDDLGWTDLGCYGSKFYEMPHIDRLARQGAMFTQRIKKRVEIKQ